MSSVPSGGNTWKNIIIGVFTTVAAYAIINFAGIGKKDNSKKIRKDATEKAWQSVNDYINYANQKFKTIACFSCDWQEMKKEMMRELENYNTKLANIKEDKNVDDKMLSLVDIIKQRLVDFKKPYTDFFDSVTIAKNLTQEEQMPIMTRIQQRLSDDLSRIINRDSADYRNYLADVNKTFNTHLEQIPLKETYDSSAIVGKWKIECVFDIECKKDGKLMWTESGTEFPGVWNLKNRLLTINLDNGQVFKYRIEQLSSKFMMIRDDQSESLFSYGACPQ